jgi:membrane protease YdiL (CAAX protease family)
MENEFNDPGETVAPPPSLPEPIIPWGWLRALLSLPLWIFMQVILVIPVAIFLGLDLNSDNGAIVDQPAGIAVQLATLLATVLIVWVLRKWVDRGTFTSLGLSFNKSYARDLVMGVICGLALISAIFLIVLGFGGLTVVSLQPPTVSLAILTIVMIIVAANEELYVRGYLLNNLMTSTNKYVALLLSSLVFALFHIFNPNGSLIGLANIVLAGLLLGIYYVHKRNLWFPIGLHFSWNLFQGGVYGSEVSGVKVASIVQIEATGDPLLTGGSFGFEASLVTTVLLAVAALVVHLIYRPRPSPAHELS